MLRFLRPSVLESKTAVGNFDSRERAGKFERSFEFVIAWSARLELDERWLKR